MADRKQGAGRNSASSAAVHKDNCSIYWVINNTLSSPGRGQNPYQTVQLQETKQEQARPQTSKVVWRITTTPWQTLKQTGYTHTDNKVIGNSCVQWSKEWQNRMMGIVVLSEWHRGGRGPLVVTQGNTNQTLTVCLPRLGLF